MPVSVKTIEEAAQKIDSAIRRTPIFRSQNFEKRIGSTHPIYFKVESLQYTGSFKARGALNKLLSLSNEERKRGVITASAGNHAQGVAFHSQRLGIEAKIVMPVSTPLIKLASTRQYGAEIVLHGESYQEAYEKALELQKKENREYIHAFDDEKIISGQGTVAKEVFEDHPEIATFICPIGGAGLISGCGTYLKEKNSRIKVIGVQAEGCSSFIPSLEAGHPVHLPVVNTIAEGMAVKTLGDITFEIAKKVVDDCWLVSDKEIAEGLLWLLENERLFVEGCGGAAVAAVAKHPEKLNGPTVVVLSGGNLDVNLLARIIERGLTKTGRLARFEFRVPDVPGSLHRLLGVFASLRASIVDVEHERIFGHSTLREVYIRVTLETQGADHLEKISKALRAEGWQPELL